MVCCLAVALSLLLTTPLSDFLIIIIITLSECLCSAHGGCFKSVAYASVTPDRENDLHDALLVGLYFSAHSCLNYRWIAGPLGQSLKIKQRVWTGDGEQWGVFFFFLAARCQSCPGIPSKKWPPSCRRSSLLAKLLFNPHSLWLLLWSPHSSHMLNVLISSFSLLYLSPFTSQWLPLALWVENICLVGSLHGQNFSCVKADINCAFLASRNCTDHFFPFHQNDRWLWSVGLTLRNWFHGPICHNFFLSHLAWLGVAIL